MTDIKEPILNYWYRALHSPDGVVVTTTDPELAKQKLYKARQEAKDEDLKKISICSSPIDPNNLWLVKRKPKNETS